MRLNHFGQKNEDVSGELKKFSFQIHPICAIVPSARFTHVAASNPVRAFVINKYPVSKEIYLLPIRDLTSDGIGCLAILDDKLQYRGLIGANTGTDVAPISVIVGKAHIHLITITYDSNSNPVTGLSPAFVIEDKGLED
jgi:hypothetical protein